MANYKTQDLPDGENTDPPDSAIVMITVDPGGTPVDQYATIENILSQPGARVYHNAAQSVNDATITILALNSEDFDNDTIHDTVTNNSRLTCKTAGKYLIGANIEWAVDADGLRVLSIKLSGGATRIASESRVTVGAAVTTRQSVMTIWDMDVGDYVEIEVYHTAGNALNVNSTTKNSPVFWMQRVGP